MRGISFKVGLLGMSLLAGPVAAGELEATVRWVAKHSPGTNSIAHARRPSLRRQRHQAAGDRS